MLNRKTNKRGRKAALFRNANLDFKEDGSNMEDTEIDLFIRELATTIDNNVKNKKIVEVVDNENQEIQHSKTTKYKTKKIINS